MKTQNVDTKTIKKTLHIEEKTESSRHYWLWVVFIITMVGVAYFFYTKNNERPREYITQEVTKKDLVISVSATGNLEPTNSVDVGIEVSGTIKEIMVDYNQKVHVGEVLAKLDTTKLASRVKNSEAALMAVKANLLERKVEMENANHELLRGKQMFESTSGNFPSQKEMDTLQNTFDRSKASYEAAKANVAQAQAQLTSDRDDFGKAVVTSSIDGVVLDKLVEIGQTVVASMQTPVLFTLAEDLTKMEVVLSVDEADIGQVQNSQKVHFSVDAYPQHEFEGVIKQVRFNSVIVDGVVTYEAVVSVDNSELLLRPGMTATAEIIVNEVKDAVVVPNAALRFTPENEEDDKAKECVWSIKNGKPHAVEVEALESDGQYTHIASAGIGIGESLIVNVKNESR